MLLNFSKLVKMSFISMLNIFPKTISLEIKYKQCKKKNLPSDGGDSVIAGIVSVHKALTDAK